VDLEVESNFQTKVDRYCICFRPSKLNLLKKPGQGIVILPNSNNKEKNGKLGTFQMLGIADNFIDHRDVISHLQVVDGP
jgi:hypothetical protein